MKELFESIAGQIVAGDSDKVVSLTREALEKGATAEEILNQGLVSGMDVVGERFAAMDMFIPEVLVAAMAMTDALEILRPLLTAAGIKSDNRLVIGTMEGDLHDIGQRLVGMIFEGAAFEVINLGADIKPQAFVEAIKKHKPNLLGMSAMLTTTMLKMDETIKLIESEGLRDTVKIMVGGAPISPDYAEKIGADGYAPNAATAVKKARELLASV
ncbi:MAG: corrinoid protein [Candidatus Auribacterota bacterium]|nr:corrinoid protein [Candidatus Auribacterota bacterium]